MVIFKYFKDTIFRFLIHQAIAGAIIGKGGENIKEIRESTGVQIKVLNGPKTFFTY